MPGAPEAVELARGELGRAPWRLVGGHVAHFTREHLVWDLVVLLALGWTCETRWPRRTRALLLGAPLLLSATFLAAHPALANYRGLSGLGSALVLLLATQLHVEGALRRTGPGGRWLAALPLATAVLFLAKAAFEAATGSAVFIEGGFVPVPAVHLAGGALGVLAGLVPGSRSAGERLSSSGPGRAPRRARP